MSGISQKSAFSGRLDLCAQMTYFWEKMSDVGGRRSCIREKAGISGRKCQVLVRKQMLEREKAIFLFFLYIYKCKKRPSLWDLVRSVYIKKIKIGMLLPDSVLLLLN